MFARTLGIVAAVVMLTGLALPDASPAQAQALATTPHNLAPSARATKPASAQRPRHVSAGRVSPRHQPVGTVIRGPDSAAMVAQLPWWRAAASQIEQIQSRERASPVLAAARNWLGQEAFTDPVKIVSADEINDIDRAADFALADADEVNAIDQTAGDAPPPPERSWLTSVLALIGGSLAAASAARFLLV